MNRRSFFQTVLGVIGGVAAAFAKTEKKPEQFDGEAIPLTEEKLGAAIRQIEEAEKPLYLIYDEEKHPHLSGYFHDNNEETEPGYDYYNITFEFFYNEECDCWHGEKACFYCTKKPVPHW